MLYIWNVRMNKGNENRKTQYISFKESALKDRRKQVETWAEANGWTLRGSYITMLEQDVAYFEKKWITSGHAE